MFVHTFIKGLPYKSLIQQRAKSMVEVRLRATSDIEAPLQIIDSAKGQKHGGSKIEGNL